MLGGIYCIKNKENNDIYFGKAINLDKRKYEHFRTLRKNIHKNIHLQRAFNKYGEKNLIFKILLYCEPFELLRYEKFFIDNGKYLYNICKESPNSTLGIRYTLKQRKKLSQINSGKNNPMYGKRHSEETKEKMSQKAFIKNNMRGKTMSENDRKRLSEISSGENNARAKLSWKDVLWIREHGKEYRLKQLADIFKISVTAINNILIEKSWKEGANHSIRNIGQNGGIQ